MLDFSELFPLGFPKFPDISIPDISPKTEAQIDATRKEISKIAENISKTHNYFTKKDIHEVINDEEFHKMIDNTSINYHRRYLNIILSSEYHLIDSFAWQLFEETNIKNPKEYRDLLHNLDAKYFAKKEYVRIMEQLESVYNSLHAAETAQCQKT